MRWYLTLSLSLFCSIAAAQDRAATDRHGDPLPPRAVARIGRVLRLRHGGTVDAVAFSPEGKLLASGGGDGAVRIWEVRSGIQRLSLPGHRKGVSQLAFAPDGKTVASGDWEGVIRLWDTVSGRELDRLSLSPEYRYPVVALTFSADGSRLAAGSEAGIAWWETDTGRRLGEFQPQPGWIGALVFAADGKSVGLSLGKQFLRYDLANGKILHQHEMEAGFADAFSDDGKLLAKLVDKGSLCLWDTQSGKKRHTIAGDGMADHRLTLSADGKLAASANTYSNRLFLIRPDTGERRRLIPSEGEKTIFAALAFSSDGKLLATGDSGWCVRIWATATGKELFPVRRTDRGIEKIRLTADGKDLMALRGDGRLFRRRVPDGKLVYELGNAESPIADFDLTANGEQVATREPTAVHIRAVATGRPLRQLRMPNLPPDFIDFAILSPDGKRLALGHFGDAVHLCDAATGNELHQFAGHLGGKTAAAFAPDGRTLVTVSNSGPVRVWDAIAGRELKRLTSQSGPPQVIFSPRGERLAVSEGYSIALWETKRYQPIGKILPLESRGLLPLAFSTHGKTLAYADRQQVLLYDVSKRETFDVLRGHDGPVRSAAFAADGKSLFTASEDGTILVWDLTTPPRPPFGANDPDALPQGAIHRLGDVGFRINGRIHSLSFSPDSKTLAVAASTHDNDPIRFVRVVEPTVRLLEIPSGKERRFRTRPPPMWYAVFSPDGKSLAGFHSLPGDTAPSVQVWDIAEGTLRYRIDRGGPPYPPLVYSPDGRLFASGFKTIALYDAATGRQLRQLKGPASFPLAFSPDGKILATSNQLWDSATGQALRAIPRDSEKGTAGLHFSGDGKTLAMWEKYGGVSVYEVATGRQIRTISGKFTEAAFSQDGKLVATGGPMIRLWDLSTGKEIRAFPGRDEIRLGYKEMRLMTISPDGKWLAAVVDDALGGRVLLWDVVRGEEVAPAIGHRGGVRSLSCAADGRTVVSAGTDDTIRVWDYIAGKERRVLADRQAKYQSATVSPDGRTIAAAEAAGAVAFLSLDGKKQGHFPLSGPREVFRKWHVPQPFLMAFSADGRIALADREVWEAGLDKPPCSLPSEKDGGTVAALSSDGTLLAFLVRPAPELGMGGSNKYLVRVRRRDTGEEICRIQEERQKEGFCPEVFWEAALSPDGKILAVSRSRNDNMHGSYFEHRLRFWEIASGRCFLKLDLKHRARALAFSPDGKHLAAAGDRGFMVLDCTIRIWDVAMGKMREELPGHGGLVKALTFSPDGRRLFSGSDDGTILVWDTHWPHPLPRRTKRALSDEQLRRAWEDLAGDDAAKAFRALGDLAAVPHRSLPFLRAHLPMPPPLDRPHIVRWIADLDSNEFAVRAKARAELEKQSELAEDSLRKALQDHPSLEVRRQIDALLAKVRQLPLRGEQLRLNRAMIALEWMQTAEARRFIEKLARGTPEARLTREAKAALRRKSEPRP